MRKILLLTTVLFLVAVGNAQTTARTSVKEAKDRYANTEISYAATSLPEGTTFKNGGVMLKKGYRASYTDNNQVVVVQKDNGGATGTFTCNCKDGSGNCQVTVRDISISCDPNGCNNCKLSTIVTTNVNSVTKASANWKQVVPPTRQVTEDPDQGGEVTNKKQSRLPAKQ